MNPEDIIYVDFPNDTHGIEDITDLEEFLTKEKEEFEIKYNRRSRYNVKLRDFELHTVLGAGSFGKVMLARHEASDRFYAIKMMKKRHIITSKQVVHTLNEKKVLDALHHPFTVYLECFFQDNSHLYFTMPLVLGGDVFSNLIKFEKFEEHLARFYAAQVLLGIEYLHYLDLVYRDLKPENLLLDRTGYIKITDFGFCKQIKGRTWTLCGTPEYLAPELILNKGYGKSVDWWSFGILIYEFCAGYTPFMARDPIKLYEKIVDGNYKVASHFSDELVEILQDFLQVDLTKRLGNLREGISEIKNHNWFKLINWLQLLNCRAQAPYIPTVIDSTDSSNFIYKQSEEITIRINKSDYYAREFSGF